MNKTERRKYNHDRYEKLREEQLTALGHKCIECPENRSDFVIVHHKVPIHKRSRTRAKSYFCKDPNLVEIRCLLHHKDTESYCRTEERQYKIEYLEEKVIA